MTQGELLPTPEKQIHQEVSFGQEGYGSHFRGKSDRDSLGFLAPQPDNQNTLRGECSWLPSFPLARIRIPQENRSSANGSTRDQLPPPLSILLPTIIPPPLAQFSPLTLSHQTLTLLSDRP